ncbi:hypothetical protein IEQ34_020647 [Dendrobium chrysotoxum]|uniref:RING-type domain-containing protein n=1 Tax=Dendrobium chrysotoxum TaxID=161865 RepID=A0AAV7FKL4_DENCH|nr:hypothetical protein IEQ34_020647 [Dendrobium chrysotoxum]
MWRFAGGLGSKNIQAKPSASNGDCSDDEVSSCASKEEGLECPICLESFNIVENVPYVLWCGHTLCKNCVLGLQCAVVKFPSAPIQLPLFISCPWCNLLSFRLVYKGNLKFPRKNFFLLWMVESLNGDRLKSHPSLCGSHQPVSHSNGGLFLRNNGYGNHNVRSSLQQSQASNPDQAGSLAQYLNAERINASLRKSLVFFVQLTAKFPLVIVFLLIVLYAIPASAAILVLYILVTILFALPSFLILYFAYPSLDWLIREIIN